MRYLGGKFRIAAALAGEVNRIAAGRPVWEPFCGGLNVSARLRGRGLASDVDAPLIALYRAIRSGWDPPVELSEGEYRDARNLPDDNPLKAFAGYGCSFGGKWFGGYARGGVGRNYASGSRKRLLSDVRSLMHRGCRIACLDFLAIEPRPTRFLIYCDPPYRGTTGYKRPFDHELFDRRVAKWSNFTTVLVSEYSFPTGREVWSCERRLELQSNNRERIERLFQVAA
jgi:DNA adenine methylase